MNLSATLDHHARFRPDRTAVVFGTERQTFATFNARVNRLANAFAERGVRIGDKIACVTPNSLEMLELYWATAKLGAVAVPLSPLLSATTIKALIGHSEATFALLAEDAAAALDEAWEDDLLVPRANRIVTGKMPDGYVSYAEFVSGCSDIDPPDAAVEWSSPLMIVYSSGTTGEPKGIVISHQVRCMYCLLYASAWRMTPESICLHSGSLVFNGAFMTLLPSFYLGGTYVLHEIFDPEAVIAAIEREKVTHMVMVPSQIIALLDCPSFEKGRLASLEALISIGATLHISHKRRLLETLGERLYEMYGLAEGFMTILDKTRASSKLESVGCPPPFFDMRIVDDNGTDVPRGVAGEIVGRGPILMEGYFRRPDLTNAAIVDGWLRTGDIGYVDDDGFLYLSDRKKDLIKSGGVSVYPRDIEEIIVRHPAIQEAAVFGVPHQKWGETPVAAVVMSTKQTLVVSKDELKDWVNANVDAKYQRIEDLIVLERFPRNAAGKTLKRSIRDEYLASCLNQPC